MSFNSHNRRFWLALALLFAFRCFYGLSLNFWNDDERQIYLLGLQYYTTGAWPYFGPDVVHTNQQIAGALQALLVGMPLHVLPWPETPILVINLLSFAGLALLGAHLSRRFPEVPRLLLFTWLLTLPWTLNLSTHVYNPSYLLFASAVFFVGFFEVTPGFATELLGKDDDKGVAEALGFLGMGFALGWCLQIHLSWPLLLPFPVIAAAARLWQRRLTWRGPVMFVAGFAVTASVLVPTLVRFGLPMLLGPLGGNSAVNPGNLGSIGLVLARFLSFGAYELPRFLIEDSSQRLAYLTAHPWLIPFGIGVAIVGVIQPVFFLWRGLGRGRPWSARALVWVTPLFIWIAFLASTRPPTARNYYVLLPIALVVALEAMAPLVATTRGRRAAVVIIAAGICYHALLALGHLPEQSLYRNRDLVLSAIEAKDYHRVGERRQTLAPH